MTRAAALAAVAATVLGCGTQDDRAAVRAAVSAFVAAQSAGDGALGCAQLTAQAREALERDAGGRSCASAIQDVRVRGTGVASVAVYAAQAQVELAGGDTVFLSRGDQGWRISAAGCRGRGDEPLDCEIEA